MLTSPRFRLKRLLARQMLTPRLAKTPIGKLMAAGGIEELEYQAAERAIEEVQREWLPILKDHEQEWCERAKRRKPSNDDWLTGLFLRDEIRRLRRRLKLGQPADVVREQTRERVRRYRERKRAEG